MQSWGVAADLIDNVGTWSLVDTWTWQSGSWQSDFINQFSGWETSWTIDGSWWASYQTWATVTWASDLLMPAWSTWEETWTVVIDQEGSHPIDNSFVPVFSSYIPGGAPYVQIPLPLKWADMNDASNKKVTKKKVTRKIFPKSVRVGYKH